MSGSKDPRYLEQWVCRRLDMPESEVVPWVKKQVEPAVFIAKRDINLNGECIVPEGTHGLRVGPESSPNILFNRKHLTILRLPDGVIPVYCEDHFEEGDYELVRVEDAVLGSHL
jgi:hypothetical protein